MQNRHVMCDVFTPPPAIGVQGVNYCTLNRPAPSAVSTDRGPIVARARKINAASLTVVSGGHVHSSIATSAGTLHDTRCQ